MNKLSRFWARATIVVTILGGVFCFIASIYSLKFFIYLGVISFLVGLYIKLTILRCPYCNWGGAVPQWSKSGTIHCPKCGKMMEYDR